MTKTAMLTRTASAAGVAYLERPALGHETEAPTTLVFLHGIGSQARSFSSLFDCLPEQYRLLAWDAPGYGASQALASEAPVAAEYAQALARWLDALGVARCVLVGHSLGTLVAAAFAKAYPGRVTQLILAASACGYQVPAGQEMPPKVAARIEDLARLGPQEFARTRAPRLVYAPEQNADLLARVEQAMSQVNPVGYGQAVHMLASGDLPGTLAEVVVPCGFILGRHDVVTPPEQTMRAATAWASGAWVRRQADAIDATASQSGTEQPHTARPAAATPDIEMIEGAGHAVYQQQPQDFAASMMRLITATPPSSSTGASHE